MAQLNAEDMYTDNKNPDERVNPKKPGVLWMNYDTGEMFVCKDNTENKNVWLRAGFTYDMEENFTRSITEKIEILGEVQFKHLHVGLCGDVLYSKTYKNNPIVNMSNGSGKKMRMYNSLLVLNQYTIFGNYHKEYMTTLYLSAYEHTNCNTSLTGGTVQYKCAGSKVSNYHTPAATFRKASWSELVLGFKDHRNRMIDGVTDFDDAQYQSLRVEGWYNGAYPTHAYANGYSYRDNNTIPTTAINFCYLDQPTSSTYTEQMNSPADFAWYYTRALYNNPNECISYGLPINIKLAQAAYYGGYEPIVLMNYESEVLFCCERSSAVNISILAMRTRPTGLV